MLDDWCMEAAVSPETKGCADEAVLLAEVFEAMVDRFADVFPVRLP